MESAGQILSETTTGGLRGPFTVTRAFDASNRLQFLDGAWGAATMPQVEVVYDGAHLSRVSSSSCHATFSAFNLNHQPGTTQFKIGANPATAATYLTRSATVDSQGRPSLISYVSSGTVLQSFT